MFIALPLGLLATPATAEKWIEVPGLDQLNGVAVDKDSIRRGGEGASSNLVFYLDADLFDSGDNGDVVPEVVDDMAVDCQKHVMYIVKNGDTGDVPNWLALGHLVESRSDQAELTYVCANAP